MLYFDHNECNVPFETPSFATAPTTGAGKGTGAATVIAGVATLRRQMRVPHLGEQTFTSLDYKEFTVSGANAKGARINAPHAPEDALACSSLRRH